MSYIDIAIIVIVALGALIGLWKGFFKTIISFFGWLVSFLIAFFLTKVVSEALLDVSAIRNFVLGTGESWSLFKWVSSFLPQDIENASGVWGVLLKPLLSIAGTSGADLNTSVALLVANGIFNIMVCIGLFIGIRIVLLLFTMFANAMTQNKAIGALNRFFGFLLGAVKGLGFVCIVFLIMSFFIGSSLMTPVREQLDKSILGKPISQTVFKMTDKFWSADGSLMDKLLAFAGIEKEGDEIPESTEQAQQRASLKTALEKMLYENTEAAAFDEKYTTGNNTYDTATTTLKQYVLNAVAKLDSPQTDYSAEQLAAMVQFVSPSESEAVQAGALYNAVHSYLHYVEQIKQADPEADNTALFGQADEAKQAIVAAIDGNADFKALFGPITLISQSEATAASSSRANLSRLLPHITFTPCAMQVAVAA